MRPVRIGFRLLGRGDLPLLSTWFCRPHVAPWWRESSDLDAIEERYGRSIDGLDPTECFIVQVDGAEAGFAQRYRVDDNLAWKESLRPSGHSQGAAGIDYLIGDENLVGRGVGPAIIEALVTATWERYPAVDEVVVSAQQDNRRSWRALEKAGFTRAWAGVIVSDDPSDTGPSFVYVRQRPLRPS